MRLIANACKINTSNVHNSAVVRTWKINNLNSLCLFLFSFYCYTLKLLQLNIIHLLELKSPQLTTPNLIVLLLATASRGRVWAPTNRGRRTGKDINWLKGWNESILWLGIEAESIYVKAKRKECAQVSKRIENELPEPKADNGTQLWSSR